MGEPAVDRGFERDTLIYVLGAMAEAVVDVAAQSPRFPADVLSRRQRRDRESPERPLMATRGAGGSVMLFAGSKPDEFRIRCQHPRFLAEVCLRYRSSSGLAGLWLQRFEGDESTATDLAVQFAAQVHERPPFTPALSN